MLGIGKGVVFHGDVKQCEGLALHGTMIGFIQSQWLQVAETGNFDGSSVVSSEASIRGSYTGKLATNHCIVGHAATLSGALTYNSVEMERGGKLLASMTCRLPVVENEKPEAKPEKVQEWRPIRSYGSASKINKMLGEAVAITIAKPGSSALDDNLNRSTRSGGSISSKVSVIDLDTSDVGLNFDASSRRRSGGEGEASSTSTRDSIGRGVAFKLDSPTSASTRETVEEDVPGRGFGTSSKVNKIFGERVVTSGLDSEPDTPASSSIAEDRPFGGVDNSSLVGTRAIGNPSKINRMLGELVVVGGGEDSGSEAASVPPPRPPAPPVVLSSTRPVLKSAESLARMDLERAKAAQLAADAGLDENNQPTPPSSSALPLAPGLRKGSTGSSQKINQLLGQVVAVSPNGAFDFGGGPQSAFSDVSTFSLGSKNSVQGSPAVHLPPTPLRASRTGTPVQPSAENTDSVDEDSIVVSQGDSQESNGEIVALSVAGGAAVLAAGAILSKSDAEPNSSIDVDDAPPAIAPPTAKLKLSGSSSKINRMFGEIVVMDSDDLDGSGGHVLSAGALASGPSRRESADGGTSDDPGEPTKRRGSRPLPRAAAAIKGMLSLGRRGSAQQSPAVALNTGMFATSTGIPTDGMDEGSDTNGSLPHHRSTSSMDDDIKSDMDAWQNSVKSMNSFKSMSSAGTFQSNREVTTPFSSTRDAPAAVPSSMLVQELVINSPPVVFSKRAGRKAGSMQNQISPGSSGLGSSRPPSTGRSSPIPFLNRQQSSNSTNNKGDVDIFADDNGEQESDQDDEVIAPPAKLGGMHEMYGGGRGANREDSDEYDAEIPMPSFDSHRPVVVLSAEEQLAADIREKKRMEHLLRVSRTRQAPRNPSSKSPMKKPGAAGGAGIRTSPIARQSSGQITE